MKLCGFDAGLEHRFFLIAGTCSIEGLQMSLDVAGQLQEICSCLGIPLVYKGSFDKANRSSGSTQRGVGMDAGLKILDEVRRQLHLPVFGDPQDVFQLAHFQTLGPSQPDRVEPKLGRAIAFVHMDVRRLGAFLGIEIKHITCLSMNGRHDQTIPSDDAASNSANGRNENPGKLRLELGFRLRLW